MRLRNRLVGPLGLRTAELGCPVSSLQAKDCAQRFGGRFPVLARHVDEDDRWGQSDRLHWDLRADYRLTDWFSPVVELNATHSLDDRDATLPFQGGDVGNFGRGEDDPIFTAGAGGELRPFESVFFRAMWETQVNQEDNLYDWRVTLSVVIAF